MAARMLYIVRGLPSAGKTTLARALAPAACTSPDDFRIGEPTTGAATAAPTLEAVNRCQFHVDAWMRGQESPIAVSTVAYSRGHVLEWVALAIRHGYQYTVVHVESGLDDADLAGRSVTRCPAEKIANIRARWQPW